MHAGSLCRIRLQVRGPITSGDLAQHGSGSDRSGRPICSRMAFRPRGWGRRGGRDAAWVGEEGVGTQLNGLFEPHTLGL